MGVKNYLPKVIKQAGSFQNFFFVAGIEIKITTFITFILTFFYLYNSMRILYVAYCTLYNFRNTSVALCLISTFHDRIVSLNNKALLISVSQLNGLPLINKVYLSIYESHLIWVVIPIKAIA